MLKFALCYGFRNLQNVVRKIKSGKCEYQFLEIMACPSGSSIPKLILMSDDAYKEHQILLTPYL